MLFCVDIILLTETWLDSTTPDCGFDITKQF